MSLNLLLSMLAVSVLVGDDNANGTTKVIIIVMAPSCVVLGKLAPHNAKIRMVGHYLIIYTYLDTFFSWSEILFQSYTKFYTSLGVDVFK